MCPTYVEHICCGSYIVDVDPSNPSISATWPLSGPPAKWTVQVVHNPLPLNVQVVHNPLLGPIPVCSSGRGSYRGLPAISWPLICNQLQIPEVENQPHWVSGVVSHYATALLYILTFALFFH